MAANIAAQAALPVALAQAQQDFEACFIRLGLNQNQVNAYVQAIGVHTVADFRITQYGKSAEKTLIKDVKVPGDNTRINNVQSVHIIAFRHWVNPWSFPRRRRALYRRNVLRYSLRNWKSYLEEISLGNPT
jgi:hypothetical protein